MSQPTVCRMILVRHGETVGNSSIRYYGRTDVALSELGRVQIRAAARWLDANFSLHQFTPIFTSPLQRAIETAQLIAGNNAPISRIAEFTEVDFGRFEGLTAEEIRDRYPEDYARWNRNRLALDFTYPGGENRGEFTARVERGVDRMEALLDGRMAPSGSASILVAAHRGVIRAITNRLAGVEPGVELGSIQILRRIVPDASANGRVRWRAEMLDVTAHLHAPE